MKARCSICLETLTDDTSPMTTVCGHLYCLDCATYNFAAPDATCAICRRPHELDALIRLYPDYEYDRERLPSPNIPPNVVDIGNGVLEACYDVLSSDDELDEIRLGSALARTDDLVQTLSESQIEAADIRNLLRNIIDVLADIRSKVDQASQITQLQEERDRLSLAARKLTDKLKEVNRLRDTERATANGQLVEQQNELAARIAELQGRLQETASMLATHRSSLEARSVETTELNGEMVRWRTQAARYKKKYHALKKEHEAFRNGVEDAFFADDSLVIV